MGWDVARRVAVAVAESIRDGLAIFGFAILVVTAGTCSVHQVDDGRHDIRWTVVLWESP